MKITCFQIGKITKQKFEYTSGRIHLIWYRPIHDRNSSTDELSVDEFQKLLRMKFYNRKEELKMLHEV